LSVNSSLPLRFFISIPMTKGTVNAISSVPRSLSVSLDGAIQNWRFQRGRGWQPNRRLRCHRIDDSASTLDLDGVYVGALVTIDRNAGSQRDANSGDGNLAVSDFYGASTISRFDYLHTVQRQLGNTDVFSVRGNVTRLTVDDRTLDLTPDVGVVALGDLYGQVTESGQRRVSGIAYGVWSDQGFLSPTRWQKLDTDWQIFLVTIVGGILTTLGTILRRTFARAALDERLTIYAS
jgi:hypothetical protein